VRWRAPDITASTKRRTCSRKPCHGSALIGSLILVFGRVFVEAPLCTRARIRLGRLTCGGALRWKQRYQYICPVYLKHPVHTERTTTTHLRWRSDNTGEAQKNICTEELAVAAWNIGRTNASSTKVCNEPHHMLPTLDASYPCSCNLSQFSSRSSWSGSRRLGVVQETLRLRFILYHNYVVVFRDGFFFLIHAGAKALFFFFRSITKFDPVRLFPMWCVDTSMRTHAHARTHTNYDLHTNDKDNFKDVSVFTWITWTSSREKWERDRSSEQSRERFVQLGVVGLCYQHTSQK
jgi:hypothetical protein